MSLQEKILCDEIEKENSGETAQLLADYVKLSPHARVLMRKLQPIEAVALAR